MPRTRVKICGITRTEDAGVVVKYGADALGLVFYPDSPRYVVLEQARAIADSVAPLVTIVGLFVDPSPDAVKAVLDSVPLGLLQFHGAETNADCKQFGMPFIKSIAVRDGVDVLSRMRGYPDASGFILDAWQPQTHGGGGEKFDWEQVPDKPPGPVILAGGLTSENVALAISTTRPYAVDVSSGVESAKGIKSAEKIAAFMKGVEHSDTGG
ncbi:MAG TPA: phosphoribosylanthranilate isomerase [Gammaproteobacteria bacterium]|nr:phosphoribosylanthranilate isomerase [Gammaproteobacteria bacterium]